jgi:hypothetical protein
MSHSSSATTPVSKKSGDKEWLKKTMEHLDTTIEMAREDIKRASTTHRAACDQLMFLFEQDLDPAKLSEFKARLSGCSITDVLKDEDGNEVMDKEWNIHFDLGMCWSAEFYQFCSKKTNDQKSAIFGIRHMENIEFDKTFEVTDSDLLLDTDESRKKLNRKVMHLFAKFAAVIEEMYDFLEE